MAGKKGGGRKGGGGKKGGSKEFEGSLNSIFDFIFDSRAQKGKLKPARISGEPYGGDEMSRALAEIAMSPLTQLSDTFLGSVGGTLLDPSIIEFQLDKFDDTKFKNFDGNAGRFRVRGHELKKFITDPNAYLKKVEEKAKKERKVARVAAMGAGIDAAWAMYNGKRSGMGTMDAWRFGSAARMSYDQGMKVEHEKMIANNAVMEREIEAASERVKNSGQFPPSAYGTPAFSSAVVAEAKKAKPRIDENTEKLHKALKSSKGLRGLDYAEGFGSLVEKDAAGNVIAKGVSTAQFKQIEADLRAELSRMNVDPNEIDGIMKGFRSEMGKERVGGSSASGYRNTYYDNQVLKLQFATDAEAKQIATNASYALTWERLKGGDEISGSTVQTSISNVQKDINKLVKKSSSSPLSPAERAQLANLESINKKLTTAWSKEQERMYGGDAFWRAGLDGGFVKSEDQKYILEAHKQQMNYEIIKLQSRLDSSTDEFTKRRLKMQIESLKKATDNSKRMMGTDFRLRMGNAYVSYNAVKGSMSLGGLMSGLPFFANGYASPGAIGARKIRQQKRDENGKLMFAADGSKIYDDVVAGVFVVGRDNVNLVAQKATNLYYFTPGSLIKTFGWNGEGFKYMAFMRERESQRAFMRDRGSVITDFLKRKKSDPNYSMFFTDDEVDLFKVGNQYTELIDLLSKDGNLPPQIASLLKVATKKRESVEGFLKWGNRFSRTGDAWNAMVTKVMGMKGINQLFGKGNQNWRKVFAKAFKNDKIWQASVAKFVGGSLGLKQVIKAFLVAAITSVVGVVTGGVALLVEGIAWVGSELVFKLARPVTVFLVIALWGVCGIIGFLIYGMGEIFLPKTVASQSIVPGEVLMCNTELVPVDLTPGNPDGSPGEGKPPSNATCPINSNPGCKQGPYGEYSHHVPGDSRFWRYAIDTSPPAGPWRAPLDGKVISAQKIMKCPLPDPSRPVTVYLGYKIVFQDNSGTTYIIIHSEPVVPAGTSVKQGDVVATVARNVPVNYCWTGAHYHLEVKNAGGWVNSLEWYNAMSCGVKCETK